MRLVTALALIMLRLCCLSQLRRGMNGSYRFRNIVPPFWGPVLAWTGMEKYGGHYFATLGVEAPNSTSDKKPKKSKRNEILGITDLAKLSKIKEKGPSSQESIKRQRVTPIARMVEETAREEIIRLSSELDRHDHLYYTLSEVIFPFPSPNSTLFQPEVSDAVYDRLVRRAEGLVAKFPSLVVMID
jgi:hypothetical protein